MKGRNMMPSCLQILNLQKKKSWNYFSRAAEGPATVLLFVCVCVRVCVGVWCVCVVGIPTVLPRELQTVSLLVCLAAER